MVLRDNRIMLVTGAEASALNALTFVPMTAGGAAAFQIDNVLAAVAAAWALGISRQLIRAVIETFDPSRDEAPGKPAPAAAA